ncbi:MAG: DUF2796 domain-containing protein [Geminicoccales bacterium]
MKKKLGIAASLALLCVAPALAEGEKRELGAHEHGHSELNIAIEGNRIEMELIAPGADIVGFEHAAESKEDKTAVEQAEERLGEPLPLFALSPDAGCSVESASVEIEGDHEEHEGEASHNEFHAAYTLTCSVPDALDGIDFAVFFDSFAGAEEIEVTVISEKGQSSYEVERDAPTVDFQGVM